jgi:uncharacterized protein (TIGR03382 family)
MNFKTLAVALVAGLTCAAQAQSSIQSIRFIGEQRFATGTQILGTNMGGLSGLAYAGNGNYLAISDDRSSTGPARFYDMSIAVNESLPANQRVQTNFTAVTSLRRTDGTTFPLNQIDPEGIALAPNGDVYVSSEGEANFAAGRVQSPFVNRFSRTTGIQNQALPVDARFNPVFSGSGVQQSGVRNNLAFESLTITPSQNFLFTATENALLQDGPAATISNPTASRIVRYDLATGQAAGEFAYIADAVNTTPIPGQFATNGLVELLALDDNNFLALERSFGIGAVTNGNTGNNCRLYHISLAGATDVSAIGSLATGTFTPVTKTLVLDIGSLGLTQDNLEALALGPILPTGEQTLIIASDNNFSATQFTQIMAFGVVIPTPGTVALAGLGLVALGRRRR